MTLRRFPRAAAPPCGEVAVAFSLRAAAPALLAAALLAGGAMRPARADVVGDLEKSAPPIELKTTPPERFQLANGIPIYFLENDRHPLVTVRAVVRAGAVWEPSEKGGVADLTGRMMRRGGAGDSPPDAMDETLDYLASEISTTIGAEQGSVTLSCLAENFEESLGVFAAIVRTPRFDEEKLAMQKNLLKEDIRRRMDNPIQVALAEFAILLWGENHPRARRATEASVDALTRDDLVAFHERFFRPANVMIGVAGAVDRATVKRTLAGALGKWRGGGADFPPPPGAPSAAARAAFAQKALPQSTILLGHLGPKEGDPHRAAGQVMMDILASGGFTSYVVDRVRNDEGLAYAAGGVLNFGRLDPGAFVLYALSKSESTCRAADLLIEQIERIRTTEVTEEELVRARDGIVNSRAFDFDSAEEIVRDFMDLVYYGLPEDHSERVIDGVGRTTAADVKRAANALLDPARLSILAVGDSAAMDCSWEKYAEKTGVPLTRISLEKAP